MLLFAENKFVSSRKRNFLDEKDRNEAGKEVIIAEKEVTEGKKELILGEKEANLLLK